MFIWADSDIYRVEQCQTLAHTLPGKIVYYGSSAYNQSITSYWALQSRLSPLCIIEASDKEDVSCAVAKLTALNIANDYNCPYAIRSGGHSFPGSNNIQGGIVLDLSLLNSVSVSKDQTLTTVLPGVRWDEVYVILDSMGLAVSGGRDAGVGVGGLSLGGMLSIPL